MESLWDNMLNSFNTKFLERMIFDLKMMPLMLILHTFLSLTSIKTIKFSGLTPILCDIYNCVLMQEPNPCICFALGQNPSAIRDSKGK